MILSKAGRVPKTKELSEQQRLKLAISNQIEIHSTSDS